MPGISAVFKKSGGTSLSNGFCSLIRTQMLHFSFYKSHQIFATEWANLGFTGYDEYPMEIIDSSDFTLVLEGRIYNQGIRTIKKTLQQIAQAQISTTAICADELKQFLLDAEGEFVLTIYDKINNRIILANDTLGRLPLYYFQDTESLIFSRELKFILPFLPQLRFSKEGVLEYLLFGFAFDKNTLVEKVSLFPAATYISFDISSGNFSQKTYTSLNIDTCAQVENRKKVAADMGRIFMEAMSNRARWVDSNKTIVSLSGGFDSRGTLAGMKKLGLNPTAVTAQSGEEPSAREVAQSLRTKVYAIPQGHLDSQRPFADIVFLKDGLDCHPDLEQMYQNIKDLRERFGGDIVYFTGIYGGEITRHSHPTVGFPTINSLVGYLLNAHDSYKYSTKKVAAIMQVPAKKIRNLLHNYLAGFPERKFSRKYVRFRHEYDVRFAGEAEDRNRFYFWTISPYFALPFFNYVMRIDENKKNSWLFRDFLFSIDPNSCSAKYFNYGITLNNPLTLWVLAFAERLTRLVVIKNSIVRIKRLVKSCRHLIHHQSKGDTETNKTIREELKEYLTNSSAVKSFFYNPDLLSLIDQEDDSQGLDRLRIVFAYIDRATRWHALLCEKSIVLLND